MKRDELEAKLKKNGIRRGSGQKAYEGAKWLMCAGNMTPREYESRIKLISDYLRI